MKQLRQSWLGVSLIEVLLVMVVLSAFIYMGVGYMQQRATAARIDRTALQMQQILNAGLAYYLANGTWPVGPSLASLQAANFLASGTTIKSPWGTDYVIGEANGNFYVWVPITMTTSATLARSYANIIAGKLPFAYTAKDITVASPPATGTVCDSTTCTVVSYVNLPGQTLNNSTAVNFAGLYHHGGCVPVPTCPIAGMTPQVIIVPVSVSGVNDAGSTNVYPISSFTGYATGPALSPDPCNSATITPNCTANLNGPAPQSLQYWRACLDVITERGSLAGTCISGSSCSASAWGQYVTLLAITRCSPASEPAGSHFTVFSD